MYAAAQAKPQSIDAEHLGPAPILGPILSALTSRVARSMPRATIRPSQGRLHPNLSSSARDEPYGFLGEEHRKLAERAYP